jgi:hypothetical protein
VAQRNLYIESALDGVERLLSSGVIISACNGSFTWGENKYYPEDYRQYFARELERETGFSLVAAAFREGKQSLGDYQVGIVWLDGPDNPEAYMHNCRSVRFAALCSNTDSAEVLPAMRAVGETLGWLRPGATDETLAEVLTYRVLNAIRKPEKIVLTLPVPTQFDSTTKVLIVLRNELRAMQRRQAKRQAASSEAISAQNVDSQRLVIAARIAASDDEHGVRRILDIAESDGTVNERFARLIDEELISLGATADDLAALLNCSKPSVIKTAAWRTLQQRRQAEQQRRAKLHESNGRCSGVLFRRR